MTPPGSPEIGDPALLGWRPIRGRRLPLVTLDAEERRLLAFFLRRYVRWCARSRHYDRVASAAAGSEVSRAEVNFFGKDHMKDGTPGPSRWIVPVSFSPTNAKRATANVSNASAKRLTRELRSL